MINPICRSARAAAEAAEAPAALYARKEHMSRAKILQAAAHYSRAVRKTMYNLYLNDIILSEQSKGKIEVCAP